MKANFDRIVCDECKADVCVQKKPVLYGNDPSKDWIVVERPELHFCSAECSGVA